MFGNALGMICHSPAERPHDLHLIRLIHCRTRRAFPGERLWTASQLWQGATARFLRLRNREGCDVHIHPYAEAHNAGYILVDLDDSDPIRIEPSEKSSKRMNLEYYRGPRWFICSVVV